MVYKVNNGIRIKSFASLEKAQRLYNSYCNIAICFNCNIEITLYKTENKQKQLIAYFNNIID